LSVTFGSRIAWLSRAVLPPEPLRETYPGMGLQRKSAVSAIPLFEENFVTTAGRSPWATDRTQVNGVRLR